jgi:tight adherence protein B
MEAELLAIAVFVCLMVIFFLYGVKLLGQKDINLAQFAPGYEGNKTIIIKKKKKEKQHISLKRSTLLVLVGGIIIGTATYAVIGIAWVSLCASCLGLIAPRLWLKWHESSIDKLISSQLEQAVEIMSSVVRSGGGIVSALRRAAKTVDIPLNNELAQVASEIELGISTADAFNNFSKRVPMQETKMMSMVMDIHQTGMAVNLGSVFEQIQRNIKSKQALQEEIRAITVENKLAGWIVAAVPFATIGIIRWTSPDFTAPLFTTAPGLFVFLTSTVMIIGGVFWIMKMANMSDF